MEINVGFHPEAREEYLDTIAWYLTHSEAIARGFGDEMGRGSGTIGIVMGATFMAPSAALLLASVYGFGFGCGDSCQSGDMRSSSHSAPDYSRSQ